MATTPPPQTRLETGTIPQTPKSEKKRLDGLWQDGSWWCNCDPRKKAALREVKKDTPNKGRFFWACPSYPFCRFFLWREDALTREKGFSPKPEAVSHRQHQNQHQQSQQLPTTPKTPSLTQRPLTSFGYQRTNGRRLSGEGSGAFIKSGSGPFVDSDMDSDDGEELIGPSRSQPSTATLTGTLPSTTTITPSSKRKREAFDDDDDDFDELGSDDEAQLVALTDSAVRDSAAKKAKERAMPTTPATPGNIDAATGLPTPSVSRTLFPSAGDSRHGDKSVSFEDISPSGVPTPTATPSANRTTSTVPAPATPLTPSSGPADGSEVDIADEAMALLRGQPIDASVLRSVRDLLSRTSLHMAGITRGRDAARRAVKLRDERIARLQERVTALENKDRMNHNRMTDFKAGLMKMYEEN